MQQMALIIKTPFITADEFPHLISALSPSGFMRKSTKEEWFTDL